MKNDLDHQNFAIFVVWHFVIKLVLKFRWPSWNSNIELIFIRYLTRFFDQDGHQIFYASIGYKLFSIKVFKKIHLLKLQKKNEKDSVNLCCWKMNFAICEFVHNFVTLTYLINMHACLTILDFFSTQHGLIVCFHA